LEIVNSVSQTCKLGKGLVLKWQNYGVRFTVWASYFPPLKNQSQEPNI